MYNPKNFQMKKNNIKPNQIKTTRVIKILCILILTLLRPTITISQSINYSCKSNTKQKVTVKVTTTINSIENTSNKISVHKYVLNLSDKSKKVFTLYTYKNKVHVQDKGSIKVDPTKDPVIFSNPHSNIYSVHIPDAFSNAHLILLNHTTINGHSFYKYEVNTDLQENFISEVIFDNNLDLDELKIKFKNAECRCTKSNITIPLRQK